MRFFLGGEDVIDYLERMTYRGAIGLFYGDTLGGVLSFLLFGLFCILALVGLITVVKWIFIRHRRKDKEDPGKRWMRTGKFD